MLVPILVLVLVLILILILILILVLLVVAASAVLVLVEQPLGVGVVVLGLHVGRVQPQRLLVAFERLLVLLLLELRVAQIVIGFGQLRLRTQRVGGGLPEGLFGAVEAFGLVEGVAEVVGGLELPRDGFERLLVTADRLLVIALGVLPVAFADQRTFGHLLRSGRGGREQEQERIE